MSCLVCEDGVVEARSVGYEAYGLDSLKITVFELESSAARMD